MAGVKVKNDRNRRAAPSNAIRTARRVLQIESRAIDALVDRVGPEFERALDIILNCSGRVIVTGIGKSGIIAKKIAATLTSTGTAAIFLHPAEGIHGDLGMVLKDDVVVCISKSGNTGEITRLFPMFREIGVPIIALTGNTRSALAERSDVVLDVSVIIEACPNDLAPTASTAASMAMGDALAVALLERRRFKAEDFAFLHPGGALGRQLLKIDDIMFMDDNIPSVAPEASFREVILEITQKRFGCTCVVDSGRSLLGIITDGDLRRLMAQRTDFDGLCAADIFNPDPKTVNTGSPAVRAREIIEEHNIMQLAVVDDKRRLKGIVHLHDLLEAGL